ncbi:hypothetical protein GA0070560_103142 [Micromonospora halophytica]|uniref:Uncharacterized protein n=1 Tax=Micromonospora halophytica TaxID=47864 RepID=A0A1C5H5Q3_9ACTN|nr:hypothetical protein GA0070560_103142 [Micromonospora halophytica]
MIERAVAAAVPGALGAAVWASAWRTELRFQASCEPTVIGDCMSWRLPALLIGPLVVTALVWFVLRLAGADRAAPSALLGAVVAADALLLWEAAQPRWLPPSGGLAALLGGTGFALGVFLAVARLPLVVQVLAAVLLLVVPFGLVPVVYQAARQNGRAEAFARLGLPLTVTRVHGYRLVAAHPNQRDRVLTVTLSGGQHSITVWTIPVPAGFAPPAHCGPTTGDLDARRFAVDPAVAPPCQLVRAEHWLRLERTDRVHLLRRGDALVVVDPGVGAPAADVDAAAANLTEVSPRQLVESSGG